MARAILTDAERLAWEALRGRPRLDAIAALFTLADGEVDVLTRCPRRRHGLRPLSRRAHGTSTTPTLFDRIEARTGIEPFGWLVG
jgi:hypothetical protein